MPKINEINILRITTIPDVGVPQDYHIEGCQEICNIVKQEFDINFSMSDAFNFWRWRSEQYDASWLSMTNNREDVKEWLQRYIDYHLEEELEIEK